MSKPQLWGGRFQKKIHQDMWKYSKSIEIDYVLAGYDICGSIAHIRMLEACGYLDLKEVVVLKKGLLNLYDRIAEEQIVWDMNSEDIHSFIEQMLYEEVGDIAGKMHIGRSRNDQVAVDFHLYVRSKIHTIMDALIIMCMSCVEKAEQHLETIIPGYTHMQRAEPIYFSHHIMAYVGMFLRDIERLQDLWKRVNISPLGAGAFSGSPIPIDNTISATLLQFDGVYENSIDAVSDRDFAVELMSILSLISMHISKLSEEIILWNTTEFAFITLSDEFCTGSSMMPQKKNPDLAELARGKTGQVYGALMALLSVLKGLPLSYNRDLQEDKKPVFESITIVEDTLHLFASMVNTMTVQEDHTAEMVKNDFSNATAIANYLSIKGMPFRESHSMSGEIVVYAMEQNKLLLDITLETYQTFSTLFEANIYEKITPKAVIETHTVRGGSALKSVKKQIQIQKKSLEKKKTWLVEKKDRTHLGSLIRFASKNTIPPQKTRKG